MDIAHNYTDFHFAMFDKPADEPILALSMAVNGLYPIDTGDRYGANYFVFYPITKVVKADLSTNRLSYSLNGEFWEHNVLLLHWQNCITRKAIYKRELNRMFYGRRFIDDVLYYLRKTEEVIMDLKYSLNTYLYNMIKEYKSLKFIIE